MKRLLVFTTVVLAITLLVSSALVIAQPLAPSVPNLIDFQGKLTTAGGPPVADGPHSFIFRIYNAPAGPTLLWSEGPVIIVTTGGLFTQQLGSSSPLPENLFSDDNPHYLEVEADGAIISPRTQLISHPFSRVANAIESKSPFSGTTYLKSWDGGHGIVTYGGDGLDQAWLYGFNWGELFLFDGDPTNDLTATLTANFSAGGELRLGNNGGATTIDLHGGLTGDASATFPTGAINAGEMLNEPGIASSFDFGTTALTGGTTLMNTVSITAPTSGFVVVTAHAFFEFSHTAGTSDGARAYLSTTAGSADFNNFAIASWPAIAATGAYYTTISLTKVEAVGPGLQTYHLNADKFLGSVNIGRRRLTAQFYPTAYGAVVSTVASKPGWQPALADGSDLPPSEIKVITAEEHQAQVAAEQAQLMADLQARIKKLEEAAIQVKQQAVEPNR